MIDPEPSELSHADQITDLPVETPCSLAAG